MVAGLVPAAFGRPDQPFNRAAREVLPVAFPGAGASGFPFAHHVVESSPFETAPNPAPNGQGPFRVSTIRRIWSRVLPRRGAGLVTGHKGRYLVL